jgi:hypothetical protein
LVFLRFRLEVYFVFKLMSEDNMEDISRQAAARATKIPEIEHYKEVARTNAAPPRRSAKV